MNKDLYRRIMERPVNNKLIPSNQSIADWALDVINLLFPEHARNTFRDISGMEQEACRLKLQLAGIVAAASGSPEDDSRQLAETFLNALPEVYELLLTDTKAIYQGDPAAISEFEVIRTYPGFYAICFYRIAHLLHRLQIPLIPRILTEHAHSKTGIDIHPAAMIAEFFHIDHGTGIVIGETCTIGRNVKMYQGVTLGALSVRKELSGIKRHPSVEDNVVIYSGATILGGETVIGHDSVIGGNVWLTQSVEPFSAVYHNPVITFRSITENS
jgi:serine O-acetyltransferase